MFPKQTAIVILLPTEELSERSSFPFFFRSDLQGLGYELGGSKVGKEEAKHSFGGQALACTAGDLRASRCKTGVFLQEFMEGCWTKTGLHPSYGFRFILPLLALTFTLDRNGSEPKKKKKNSLPNPVFQKNPKNSRSRVFPWLHLSLSELRFGVLTLSLGEIGSVCGGGVVGPSSLMGTRRPSTRTEKRLPPLFTLPEASIRFC